MAETLRNQYCPRCKHKWRGVHRLCPECGGEAKDDIGGKQDEK